jgi:hypothetical protein
MRRSSLFFLMVACLAGCGSDGGKTSDTKTGSSNGANGVGDDAGGIAIPDNQGGDGDTSDEKYPGCPRDQLPPFEHYTGTKIWTAADFTACGTACPNGDAACVMANCAPGAQEFNDCANQELSACASDPAGPCRPEFEDEICCAGTNCDAKAADVATCVQTKCATEIGAFKTCGTADAAFRQCAQVAVPLCLADGGGATGADAGTPNAPPTGTGTTTTNTLQSLSALHGAAHVLPLMFSTLAQ